MTVNHHPKVAVHAVKSFSDPLASQGARRATVDAPASAAKNWPADACRSTEPVPSEAEGLRAGMEVVAGRRRPAFSRADRQRILQAADRCSAPGEIGALMRREGVYSSSLSTWRKQRKAAELAALAPRKRGPKPAADRDQVLRIAEQANHRAGLCQKVELHRAIIDGHGGCVCGNCSLVGFCGILRHCQFG